MSTLPALHARPLVLSIGTTEPLTAAGIGLDILLADRLEVRPLIIVAGVSAQDGRGTFGMQAVDASVIAMQCEAVSALPIAAIRIGAIPSAESIRVVAAWLKTRRTPVILDPIFATSSGHRLLDDAALAALRSELLPLASCITPNLSEAEELSGYNIATVAEMDAAVLAISRLGAQTVLLKGGHLHDKAVDVFWDGFRAWHYEAPRLSGDMRGTGCALAMAMAAALAHGQELRGAIRVAREIVRLLLVSARPLNGQRIVA